MPSRQKYSHITTNYNSENCGIAELRSKSWAALRNVGLIECNPMEIPLQRRNWPDFFLPEPRHKIADRNPCQSTAHRKHSINKFRGLRLGCFGSAIDWHSRRKRQTRRASKVSTDDATDSEIFPIHANHRIDVDSAPRFVILLLLLLLLFCSSSATAAGIPIPIFTAAPN